MNFVHFFSLKCGAGNSIIDNEILIYPNKTPIFVETRDDKLSKTSIRSKNIKNPKSSIYEIFSKNMFEIFDFSKFSFFVKDFNGKIAI